MKFHTSGSVFSIFMSNCPLKIFVCDKLMSANVSKIFPLAIGLSKKKSSGEVMIAA